MSTHARPFLIHESEASQASNAAAARLELCDAIHERMYGAMAIVDLIGATNVSNLADDTLPYACMTARHLMKEVNELLAEAGL